MQGRYAVLGWGSLIWDLDNLAEHVELPWQMQAGPSLPMEFTRISAKRKMGLAVCLDHDHGTPCPTHAIASRRGDLATAIQDLAARERAPVAMIGGVCRTGGVGQGRSEIAEQVREWCARTGWQGAVWTDLRSNYTEMSGRAFSVPDALAYLRTLTGDSLDEAVRYLHLAPLTTQTRLREALQSDDWWHGQVRRLFG
ncbi:MAG: hypothetical protein AAF674_17925 [Pseudomonadota bacterium]